jgi:hypothetical protein
VVSTPSEHSEQFGVCQLEVHCAIRRRAEHVEQNACGESPESPPYGQRAHTAGSSTGVEHGRQHGRARSSTVEHGSALTPLDVLDYALYVYLSYCTAYGIRLYAYVRAVGRGLGGDGPPRPSAAAPMLR